MKLYQRLLIAPLLLFTLASCDFRGPDILPPVEEMPYGKIIGMQVDPPDKITFYTDDEMTDSEKRLMAECFLAAVVIPEEDLWVNLMMGQRSRIAAYHLGVTELGRLMLEQDYLLKKASSTAYYPENDSGYRFWSRIDTYGSQRRMPSEIRVWIYPKRTVVADNAKEMFIKSAELDVKQEKIKEGIGGFQEASDEIILPQIREYVLRDKHFIPIRQAYRAVICAIWFKNKFPDTIYHYCINTNKTAAFAIPDTDMKYKLWDRYALSFRRKDYQDTHPYKKRVWGGVEFKSPNQWIEVERQETEQSLKDKKSFKITLEPSSIEALEDAETEAARGELGGIDFSNRIAVSEEYFTTTEDALAEWQSCAAVSYRLE